MKPGESKEITITPEDLKYIDASPEGECTMARVAARELGIPAEEIHAAYGSVLTDKNGTYSFSPSFTELYELQDSEDIIKGKITRYPH